MKVLETRSHGRTLPPEQARSDIVAFLSAAARALFTNGETTRRTIVGVERLGQALGVNVAVLPRWGEVMLRIDDPAAPRLECIAATPLGVDMRKVAATHELIDRFCHHDIGFDAAQSQLAAIRQLPPISLVRFVLLTAAGAAALGVIFGAYHWLTLVLIALSAGAGAALRRWLAELGGNPFVQPFCAALLAGIVGALVARFQISSVLRLVAVCPCMVLVPGPHFLNGAIDLARARIALGACRIGYASLITLVISVGLLAGLSLGGVELPASVPAATVPLGYDVIAAGIAVAAYGTFFAMPWRMLPIPIVIGMLAHASRWLVIVPEGGSAETGALVACFVVGVIVTPVADRLRMPFAAFAFASVVSLIPGVYIFRMAGGLLNLITPGHVPSSDRLLGAIVDGATALLIIVAMAFGLIVPKLCIEYFFPGLTDSEPAARQ
ncbi:MAG: threonine/serine exporter ThrE family protein [Xanthobacteraceae bacterium]